MPCVREITAHIVEIPLRQPFVTAQDRLARQVSRPVVVALRLDDGRVACGEAVPVAYVTGETPETVLAAVQTAAQALIGADTRRLVPALLALGEALPDAPTARAGVEMALYDAWSQSTGVSLWHLFGGAVTSVETDITLSLVADVVERAQAAAGRGLRCFKMKVGGTDPDAEIGRVIAVHRAVSGATIRLDANQGFDAASALAFIRRVVAAGVRLELVEQPVAAADLPALDLVAAASPVPVIADEAVKSPADALRVLAGTRVHGVNVKLMKAGVQGALEIAAIVRAARRKLMIGCMLETRRGIAFSLALACGTGAFSYVDLDSHMLLADDGYDRFFGQQGARLEILPS